MRCNDQGTEFEFTVFQIPAKGREVLKLNQGFPGPALGGRSNFCQPAPIFIGGAPYFFGDFSPENEVNREAKK